MQVLVGLGGAAGALSERVLSYPAIRPMRRCAPLSLCRLVEGYETVAVGDSVDLGSDAVVLEV